MIAADAEHAAGSYQQPPTQRAVDERRRGEHVQQRAEQHRVHDDRELTNRIRRLDVGRRELIPAVCDVAQHRVAIAEQRQRHHYPQQQAGEPRGRREL
jgi:hypothetical protein